MENQNLSVAGIVAIPVYFPAAKVLDALLLTQATHQQLSVLFRHDVALQTFQHHLSVLRRMHTQFRHVVHIHRPPTLAIARFYPAASKVRSEPQLPRSLHPNSAGSTKISSAFSITA